MKRLNKRGISDVVSTVLIVLLVVVCVTFVSVSVMTTVKTSMGSVSGLKINLDIITEEGYTLFDNQNNLLTVQVGRGNDNEALEAVYVVSDCDGSSKKFKLTSVPEINSNKVYCLSLGKCDSVSSIKVYPQFKTNVSGAILDSVSKNEIATARANEKVCAIIFSEEK